MKHPVSTLIKWVLPDAVKGRLGALLWRQLNPAWRLPSGLRIELRSAAEWVIYNDIFVDGEYDWPIDAVVNGQEVSPLILDVGANVGYFSLRFADRWHRARGGHGQYTIVGVEGSPATFAELSRRVSQPELMGSCRFHLGLVGARTGSGYISTTPFHVTDSIVRGSARGGVRVAFVDLEALLPEGRRVSLLKCDIEGAEELFLENYPSLLRRVDRAVFEFHHDSCDVPRCLALLEEAGLTHQRTIRKYSSISIDAFHRAPAGRPLRPAG